MKSLKVLLIIPAYNEEESILNTYDSILNYNKCNKSKLDVIVIDDGSNDNTKSILKLNNIPHISLVNNLGIGGAVQTGYKYAYVNNYDIAVQFDGDGQHDVNYVEKICKPIIDNKCGLVIGSRFVENSSNFKSTVTRRIGIKVISFTIKLLTNKKIYDPTSGFRACDRRVISLYANEYPREYPEPISEVTLIKNKIDIHEIPVSMNERKGGVSSIRAWKTIYYMLNVCFSIFIESIRRVK